MKKSSICTNVFFYVLKAFMGIVFPLISFPYAARVLGAENLGMVQYCNSIISYFNLFAGLGISLYATREGVKYREDREKLTRFSKEMVRINMVTVLISYIVLFFVILGSGLKEYSVLLGVCSLNIFFMTFSIDWLYQILEQYSYISIRSVFFQFLSLLLLLTFVRNRQDFVIYAFINVFASGGSFIFNIWNSRKYVSWFKKTEIKLIPHFRPILTIFVISASASIYLNLDTLMIGSMKGNLEVGLYSAAVKLITVVKTLLAAVSGALLPRLSYYRESEDDKFYFLLLKKSVNIILLIVVPASCGIIMLRKEILYIFGGPEFVTATFACSVLAINMVFSVVDGMLYNQFFLPMKMEGKTCVATICGAASNFILNLCVIPYFGYNGAAVTTLISEFLVFSILLFFMRKEIKISYLFCYFPQYIFASCGIIVIVLLCHKFLINNFLCMCVSVLTSIVYYLLVMIVIKNQFALDILNYCKKRIEI